MPTATKEKKAKKPAKPVAACQLEVTEADALDALAEQTGRSQSYLVRLAVARLLRDAKNKKVDFAKSIETHATE